MVQRIVECARRAAAKTRIRRDVAARRDEFKRW
jgi:hypothetical protein